MGFSLIFERKLIMGHRLYSGLSPKCAIPHGHNEIIRVEIKSHKKDKLNYRDNMIAPFEKVKKTWHHYLDEHLDHAFQLSEKDPLLNYFKENEPEKLKRIVVLPGDPSTEIMAAALMFKLDSFLEKENPELYTDEILIRETPTNSVKLSGKEVYKEILPHSEPGEKKKYWWEKNDFSINNF